jgi:hypothetical protein
LHDTVSHCMVWGPGLLVHFFGERIYVGSANKNWCDTLQTVVACDNEVSGAALGLSTIACTPA